MLEEREIQGLGKCDDQRILRAGARRGDSPFRGIGRDTFRGPDAEGLAVVFRQRRAASIEPGAMDDERVAAALFERGSRLGERRKAAFDSAGIEENREAAVTSTAPQPKEPTRPADRGPVRESAPSRVRRAAITGTASLVLVSASGAAWKLSHNGAPVSRTAATPAAAQLRAATPLPATQEGRSPRATPPPQTPQKSSPQKSSSLQKPWPQPQAPEPRAIASTAPGKGKTQPDSPPATALRRFVPPVTKQTPVQGQSGILPLPPGSVAILSAGTIPGLPGELVNSANAPAQPPAAPTQPVASAPAPTPKSAVPSGGRLQEPQLIDRTLPDFPALARQRGIFGVVRMEALVDEHGAVNNVKVVSGDPILAAAAKIAVLKWKYKAATLNGKPIAITVAIQVLFADRNK